MRDAVSFLLNGEKRSLRGLSPTTTLLDYLRESEGLCGTKEGCAEGDCGACTVAVGELRDGRVRHLPLNACIQFLPMLEGKSVVTVEKLAGPGRSLHPCQEALVETHGSQCGFCTPGFVMSLYSAYRNETRLDRQGVNDLLAGNLCRCTRNGPNITAAETNHDYQTPAWEAAELAAEKAGLQTLQHDETLALETAGQRCFAPASIENLATIYQRYPDAVLVSGATDVGLWVTKQHRHLETLIHLGRVRELNRVIETDGVLTLGAAVTYSDAFGVLDHHFPEFAELLRPHGDTQVRSAATLGGNLANGSPIGDSPPALIALGAFVVLRAGPHQRRLPLEDFFIDYGRQDRKAGEFVEALEIPLSTPPERLRCYKLSKRFDQDITAVLGCFNIAVDDGQVAAARIVFGGMAATPKRAAAVEAALVGQAWSEASIEAALPRFDADFAPISDMRASADYRLRVAKNLLRKYFHESHAPLAETRLVGRGATISAVAS